MGRGKELDSKLEGTSPVPRHGALLTVAVEGCGQFSLWLSVAKLRKYWHFELTVLRIHSEARECEFSILLHHRCRTFQILKQISVRLWLTRFIISHFGQTSKRSRASDRWGKLWVCFERCNKAYVRKKDLRSTVWMYAPSVNYNTEETWTRPKQVYYPFKDEAYLFYIGTQCVPRCEHSPVRL
jgi:hypothetical protein